MFDRTPTSNKRVRSSIETDDEDADGPTRVVKLGKKGEPLAPCGRPSFGDNKVNKKYNSRYRNPKNTNKLGGKLLTLGHATGIVSMTLFGFDVSFEHAQSGDRLRIFKSAAWYALTEEELAEILEHTDDEIDDYIKGIITAGIRLWRHEAPEEARKIFQNDVFAPLIENPIYQEHLALGPGQRVQSQ